MKYLITTSFSLLILCACSGEGVGPATNGDGASTSQEELHANPVAVPAELEFPDGFLPTFAYRIRSKKVDSVEGVNYRKLVIEYKGIEAGEVDASIEATLAKAGFRRYKDFVQDNGAIVGDYGQTGRRVTVTTTPQQEDMKLLDADSRGTVYFVWKAE